MLNWYYITIMLNKTVRFSIVLFLLFYLFFGVRGTWTDIPFYQLFLQFLFAIISYLCILNSQKIVQSKIFVYTFAFQFGLAILLKIFFVLNAETEFGPSAIDSLGYFEFAQRGAQMNLSQFQYYMSDTSWAGIDDKGYLFFLRTLFVLFPKGSVAYIVILLNAFFIAISSVALYKTMIILDPIQKRNAITVTCVFSSFLTFVNTSAVGLKEDVFIPIIILALYYYLRFRKKCNIINFTMLLLFTLLTVFFRTAITASLILVFAIGFISSKNNKKYVAFSFYISIVAFPIVVDFVTKRLLGIPLEGVMAIAQARNEMTTGAESSSKMIGNVLASVIGPFPTFVDSHDTMFYSFSSILKMLLNLPVLCAVIRILRKYDYRYYFVTFLYLIGIMFNIVVGTGLDMRYQMPFWGAFLLLFFYYLNTIELKPIFYYGYSFGCAGITFIYNMIK